MPYELPCATSLIFDEAQGTCVREDQASEFARKCTYSMKKGIDGFICPDKETIGPHGQVSLDNETSHCFFLPPPVRCFRYMPVE